MDKIDQKILTLLQEQFLSNQDLAEQVALSPSPCSRRVKHLQDSGYIKKHVAILDDNKLGFGMSMWILVALDSHTAKRMMQFEQAISSITEVMQCYLITGQSADYLLKIITKDTENYHKLLFEKLLSIEGVSNTHSSFVLRTIINKTALPLARS